MKKYVPVLFAAIFLSFLGAYAAYGADPVFPVGETAYQINTSKGSVAAAFKFAPAIQKILFSQSNYSTYLGTHFKNIAWIANRYGGGPAGRWDISNPWSPKESDVVGLSNGPATDLGSGQPPEHRGPWSNAGWPHSGFFQGAVFADQASGEGRFAIAPIITEQRGITAVLRLLSSSGISIGQLFADPIGEDLFTVDFRRAATDTEGMQAIDAAASGKFFLFAAGEAPSGNSSLQNQVYVFDIGNLSGSITPPDLAPISTYPWTDVTEFEVVEVPGVRNHFLVARASGKLVSEKPRFYIAEVNADNGSIVRSNTFTLDIAGISYSAPYSPGAKVFPGSNIEYANADGKTYVFMNEKFTRSGYASQSPGTLKIDAYVFNPQALTFTKKGDITLANFPNYLYGDRGDAWSIVKADSGSAYPLLAAIKIGKTKTTTNSYGQTITQPILFDLGFYGLKDFLSATTAQSLAPTVPDVLVPGQAVGKPLTIGQVVLSGIESGGTYHAFLKQEGAKTNLYLYRKALLFTGYEAVDPTMPYANRTTNPSNSYWMSKDNDLGSSFRGSASLRIDRIDVSAFAGSGTVTQDGCAPANRYNIFTGALCPGQSPYVFIWGTSPAPVIGAINGPTSLGKSEQGIWTVTAADQDNDDLTWSVDWGAGRSTEICRIHPSAGTGQNSAYTFSHSWAEPGNYSVKIYVNDCKGGMANKSFTVHVQ